MVWRFILLSFHVSIVPHHHIYLSFNFAGARANEPSIMGWNEKKSKPMNKRNMWTRKNNKSQKEKNYEWRGSNPRGSGMHLSRWWWDHYLFFWEKTQVNITVNLWHYCFMINNIRHNMVLEQFMMIFISSQQGTTYYLH